MNTKRIVLLTLGCITLAACGTTESTNMPVQNYYKELPQSEKDLARLEKAHIADPEDANKALNYAAALREKEYLNRASIVLTPFAADPNSPARMKAEFAAVQLELGNMSAAENAARKAIIQDKEFYEAHHYLGIALDAQEEHKLAETAFRKALEIWEGDPTPVMNNLALNLATQEKLSEAIEMLEKAQAISPERTELERNLRIIRALKETKDGTTSDSSDKPKPNKKPS